MRLFEVPDGARLTLLSEQIGAAVGSDSLWFDRRVYVAATATGDYDVWDGVWRRRFTNCEPPLCNHSGDVWVSDTDRPLPTQLDLLDEVEELAHR